MNPQATSAETIDRMLQSGHVSEAVSLNSQAVAAGDRDAIFQRALWHLIGSPLARDLVQARRLLRLAAAKRHPDAAMVEVALQANGTGAVADWAGALARLKEVASWLPVARDQLRSLEVAELRPDGGPKVQPIGEALDPQKLVWRFRALASPPQCATIARSVADLMAPSVVVDPATGRQVPHPVRTSHSAVVGPTRESLPIRAINLKLAAITGTTVDQGEALTILRYGVGQEFRLHLDTLPTGQNQRIATVLIYLNDGFEGGETLFPELGLRITARAGDAIMFRTLDGSGQPDTRLRHAGLPVTRGVKWLATRWIRQHPIDPWNSGAANG